LPQLIVMELTRTAGSVEALVGRDMLAHLLVILDGQRDAFTLAD
jgi:hypothetical protein